MENELADSLRRNLCITPTEHWQDVTSTFLQAAKDLTQGQMIHVEDFNLNDSMSAIELMDPKMDAGAHYSSHCGMNIAERIQYGACLTSFSRPIDVIATLNDMFCWESTYLMGSSLNDTLANSEYFSVITIQTLLEKCNVWTQLLDKKDIRGAVHASPDSLSLLMAVIPLSSMKLCSLIHTIVVRADIYDDEDFSTAYTFDTLVDTIDTQSILEVLAALESRLSNAFTLAKRFKIEREKKSGKKKLSHERTNEESWMRHDDQTSSYIEMFLRRVQLRKIQLEMLHAMEHSNTLQVNISQAKELLQSLATETLCHDAKCFSGRVLGFDPYLSHINQFHGLPRVVDRPSLEESVDLWIATIDQLSLAFRVDQLCESVEELKMFLRCFSQKQPHILARSFLLLLISADAQLFGKHSFSDWLAEDMVHKGAPRVLLSTAEGSDYALQSIEVLYESLKVYLQTRSRQRLRMEYLLKDWSILQMHAACLDDTFMQEMKIPKSSVPRYLSAWSMEQAIDLCMHYLLLGFELELYASHEYGMMFWYLDYLLGSRLQNLHLAYSFQENLKYWTQRPTMLAKKRTVKKEKKQTNFSSKEENNAFAFQYAVTYAEMIRFIARGFSQTFLLLERMRLIKLPSNGFGSQDICFRHRFAAMKRLLFPKLLSYDEYRAQTMTSPSSCAWMISLIQQCFSKGEELADQLRAMCANSKGFYLLLEEELQQIAQMCAENRAGITALNAFNKKEVSAIVNENGEREAHAEEDMIMEMEGFIDMDISMHGCFPVIRLQRVKKEKNGS